MFKEQKKSKETVLVAESAYKTQKSQFSRVVEIKVGARNQELHLDPEREEAIKKLVSFNLRAKGQNGQKLLRNNRDVN